MATTADQPSIQQAVREDIENDSFALVDIDAGYDFALVGRTGMGKSTLGNELLRGDRTKIRLISPKTVVGPLEDRDSESERVRGVRAVSAGVAVAASAVSEAVSVVTHFFTADDYPTDDDRRYFSVTKKCKLLVSDETKVRVLDVPGFFDSDTLNRATGSHISVHAGNLQTMRWIARVQACKEINLRVRRVAYFLPFRGPPEKADGILQEELQLMHHFFGAAIFKCMVVVATNKVKIRNLKRKQEKFDREDIEDTKKVFHIALKSAIRDNEIGCPPIVYIGINDKDVLAKLREAPVLKDEPLKLEIVDGTCAQCGVKFRSIGEENLEIVTEGTSHPYEGSKCHPCFVQKYSSGEKLAGGFAHVVTLGIVYAAARIRGRTIWPGFTTADEICPVCHLSPGSPGCTQVEESVQLAVSGLPKHTIVVNHTNEPKRL